METCNLKGKPCRLRLQRRNASAVSQLLAQELLLTTRDQNQDNSRQPKQIVVNKQ